MLRPRIPRPGDPLYARDIAWILKQVFARLRGGQGIRVTQYPEGDTIIANTRKRGGGGGGAADPLIPFKLSVAPSGEDFAWRVSSQLSTVIDGTNGEGFDLSEDGTAWATGAVEFDESEVISSTGYIVLRADIGSSLAASNWRLDAVEFADSGEVVFGTAGQQTRAQLIIGKVDIDTVADPPTATVTQAVYSPQRLTHGFVNGVGVRVFDSAPFYIPAPEE
jgi:hypothetical protein